MPQQLVTAKTVYIDNQSGSADIGDRCYDEVTKWGRFRVTTDKREADLVFLLSVKANDGGYVTSGGGTTGRVDDYGNINTTTNPSHTQPVTVNYTYLTVIDPKTADTLWSDSKKWGFKSATKGLVSELMKRMDESKPADKRN